MRAIQTESGSASLSLDVSAGGQLLLRLASDDPQLPTWCMPLGPRPTVIDSEAERDVILVDLHLGPSDDDSPGDGFKVRLRCDLHEAVIDNAMAVQVRLRLQASSEEPIDTLAIPGPLHTPFDREGAGWRYILPDGQGIIADPYDDPPMVDDVIMGRGVLDEIIFSDYRKTLPIVAAVHDQGAVLAVSTVQGHDHAVRPFFGEDAAADGVGFRISQLPSLGTWRYDREWTISSVSSGGVNSLAQLARDEVRRSGVKLTPINQKLQALDSVARNGVGGTHLWCHMDTLTSELVTNLHQAGIRSLMIMGRPADDTVVAKAHAYGFSTGPYFQTYDVFPPGTVHDLDWRNTYPPEGSTSGWPETLRRDEHGFLDAAWVNLAMTDSRPRWVPYLATSVDGQVRRWRATFAEQSVQSFRRCPRHHAKVVRQYTLPTLDDLGSSAVFFDIATTMFGLECFCTEMNDCDPCDRRADVEHRLECLQLLRDDGRIVSSEDGKWWALDHVLSLEGALNFDGLENINNITLTDYPVPDDPWTAELSLDRRVPLFALVAGHTADATLWWGRGQDRHLETQHAKNALVALHGGQPIFVVDDLHPINPGTARFDFVVETSKAFDVLREATMGVGMLHYERLGKSAACTTFENGTRVFANLGKQPEAGLEAQSFEVFDRDGRLLCALRPHGDTARAEVP